MKADELSYESPAVRILHIVPEQIFAGSLSEDENEDMFENEWDWGSARFAGW